MKVTSQSLADTRAAADTLLARLTPREEATIVALQGDLGAGKTAFTQEVGKILNIRENIHSPTFVIEKIYDIDYHGFQKLIHIDAYRIEKEAELVNLGWHEITKDPKNLIFIEWPELVPNLIPQDAVRVSLEFVSETVRHIHLHEES